MASFNIHASLNTLLAFICAFNFLTTMVHASGSHLFDILERSDLTSEYTTVAAKHKMAWLTKYMKGGPLAQPSHYLVSVMRMCDIGAAAEKAIRWSPDGKYIAGFVEQSGASGAALLADYEAHKSPQYDTRVVNTINDVLETTRYYTSMKRYVLDQLKSQVHNYPYDVVQGVLRKEIANAAAELDARQNTVQALLTRVEAARKQKADDEEAEKAKKEEEEAKKAKEAEEALEKLKDAPKVDEKLAKELDKTPLLADAKRKSRWEKFAILVRIKQLMRRMKPKKWRLWMRKMNPLAWLKSTKRYLSGMLKRHRQRKDAKKTAESKDKKEKTAG